MQVYDENNIFTIKLFLVKYKRDCIDFSVLVLYTTKGCINDL